MAENALPTAETVLPIAVIGVVHGAGPPHGLDLSVTPVK